MAAIEGKIRIQIDNPCQPWDTDSAVTYYNCDGSEVTEDILMVFLKLCVESLANVQQQNIEMMLLERHLSQ